MKNIIYIILLYIVSINSYSATVVVSSSMPGHGFGDYMYAKKIYDMLACEQSEKALLLSGTSEEKNILKKTLGLDEESTPNFIWVEVTLDDQNTPFINREATNNKLKSIFSNKELDILYVSISSSELVEETFIALHSLLRNHGIKKYDFIGEMAYGEPTKKQAKKNLKTILQGLGNSEHTSSFKNDCWLTTAYEQTTLSDKFSCCLGCLPETCLISCLGDDSSKRKLNYIIQSGENIKKISRKRLKSYEFGLSYKKNKKIGFLIEDASRSPTEKGNLAKELTKETPQWFLKALTTKPTLSEQEEWLINSGNFFVGYMHKDFSLIDFIASTADINSNDNLT